MPVRAKSLQLSATFHCKELLDLTGTCVVQVERGGTEEENLVKDDGTANEIEIPGLDIP